MTLAQTESVPSRRPERLVLVDIENLCGTQPKDLSAAEISDLMDQAKSCIRPTRNDHVVLACNPHWAFAARSAWPTADLRVEGGKDGADRALCETATEALVRRFREVWIVSGDGRLVGPARLARRHGRKVTVISRTPSLSGELRAAADDVLPFRWSRGSVHRWVSRTRTGTSEAVVA